MANKRIFYASQSINLQPVSTGTNDPVNYRNPNHYVTYGDENKWVQPHGLQSAGVSTTFSTEPVSQLGTLKLYSQTETSPEVEVTLSKVIDGTASLYSICTSKVDPANTDNLTMVGSGITEVSTNMVNVRIGVSRDLDSVATGSIPYHTLCQRMYLSQVTFTLPVDGNATEEVTLVGSNKTWGGSFNVPQDVDGTPLGTGTQAVVRRQNVAITGVLATNKLGRVRNGNGILTTPPSHSLIPSGVYRESGKTPRIQNITVSANFNRENINELGFFGPYYKYTTFPIEVTSEFEVVSVSGDMVSANDFDDGIYSSFDCARNYSNLENDEIVIKVCGVESGDALYLDLGDKNKLTSVNYTGGDAGGGNATVTYSYQTFNKLHVIPEGSYADYVYHDGSTYDTATLQS